MLDKWFSKGRFRTGSKQDLGIYEKGNPQVPPQKHWDRTSGVGPSTLCWFWYPLKCENHQLGLYGPFYLQWSGLKSRSWILASNLLISVKASFSINFQLHCLLRIKQAFTDGDKFSSAGKNHSCLQPANPDMKFGDKSLTGLSFLCEDWAIFRTHLLSLINILHITSTIKRDFIFFGNDRLNILIKRFLCVWRGIILILERMVGNKKYPSLPSLAIMIDLPKHPGNKWTCLLTDAWFPSAERDFLAFAYRTYCGWIFQLASKAS